jgi:hypothetical protein
MPPTEVPSITLIIIEPREAGYAVYKGRELVSTHADLEIARFRAFLEAHRLNPAIHSLDLEPDEDGNLVALIQQARAA